MRTLVDIPAEDLDLVNGVAKKLDISRAEFVRRAISHVSCSRTAPIRRRKPSESGATAPWMAWSIRRGCAGNGRSEGSLRHQHSDRPPERY